MFKHECAEYHSGNGLFVFYEVQQLFPRLGSPQVGEQVLSDNFSFPNMLVAITITVSVASVICTGPQSVPPPGV